MRGLFKVINGGESRLTNAESTAIIKFKKALPENKADEAENLDQPDDSSNYSYAEKILALKRKQPSDSSVPGSVYLSMQWIVPTQVECERLFSECKYILTQERSGMNEYSFEMAIFLKKHYQLWDPVLLSTLVVNHARPEDEEAGLPEP